MIKLYAGLGLILLLGVSIWYVHSQSYRAGVNAERTEWQSQLLDVTRERDALRAKAENTIIEERVVYRDRIKTIQKSVNMCVIPPDILGVLADAGLYTAGEM